jgi:hypothetical protein
MFQSAFWKSTKQLKGHVRNSEWFINILHCKRDCKWCICEVPQHIDEEQSSVECFLLLFLKFSSSGYIVCLNTRWINLTVHLSYISLRESTCSALELRISSNANLTSLYKVLIKVSFVLLLKRVKCTF